MEKIININLAGRVIAIEDTAYTSLKNYLESLRAYFAAEEGRDEIINDIESRIAELMGEQIKRGSTAITDADVSAIIAAMGSVEDFEQADGEEVSSQDASGTGYSGNSRTRSSKRFFRDSNDKLLGGVCSGLANYLNVDPALVRIVFAILTVGGWGAGLLLYIALWILVPAAPLDLFRGRRLFRNPDDKMIGGVAGGLGAYFHKDPKMFRGLFAIPLILSVITSIFDRYDGTSIVFGSFSGTFILIYIILWIVLPEANSEFEKMEMRGEKVDVSSIRDNVYAGMEDIKDRAKEWTGEVKESVSRLSTEAARFANTRGRSFAREAAAAAGPLAARGGHVLGSIIKGFFLFVASMIAFALFVVLIGYSFSGVSEFVNDFILRTQNQRILSWATVILFFGIPLIAIITLIVRRILKIRSRNSYLGWTFAGLWVVGIICAVTFAASLATDFRRYENVNTDIPILQPASGKLTLKVGAPAIRYSHSLSWLHSDEDGWDITGDSMRLARVQVMAELSPDSQYHVSIQRYGAGSNAREAITQAQQIAYSVSNMGDSVLMLDHGFGIGKAQKYRRQNVVVTVQVPAGKKLRIDRSVDDKLCGRGFLVNENDYRHSHRWDSEWDDVYEEWEPDIDYVMSSEGKLMSPAQLRDKHTVLADTLGHTEPSPASTREIDSLNKAADAIQRRKEALEKVSQ